MTTWRNMAISSRTAAYELFEADRWRSVASRAYYAVYSEVTHALLQAGVVMPTARGNPAHAALPLLIGNNLISLSLAVRWRLAGLVSDLYTFRIIGDYGPQVTFEEADAIMCLSMLKKAFQCLKDIP